MMFAPIWGDEHVAVLKEGYDKGLSFSAIARLILARCNVSFTKNAVIGKAHRLNLFRGKMITKPKQEKLKKARVKFSAPIDVGIEPDGARDLAPEIISDTSVTLLEARGDQCRWPIGEVGTKEFRFCGAHGYPWCRHHGRIAYAGRR